MRKKGKVLLSRYIIRILLLRQERKNFPVQFILLPYKEYPVPLSKYEEICV